MLTDMLVDTTTLLTGGMEGGSLSASPGVTRTPAAGMRTEALGAVDSRDSRIG
jgi:hypothetical protein